MRIIILGLAGAGKGTQGQILATNLKLPYISSGDLFRRHQSEDTNLGRIVKSYIQNGNLVPDEITIEMILTCLSDIKYHSGFILDGFPRTLNQAKVLDESIKTTPIDFALHIKVSEEELVRRISSRVVCIKCSAPHQISDGTEKCPICQGELYQRTDDKPEIAQKRIRIQWVELNKLLDHYSKNNILSEINGEQGIEAVKADIITAISHENTLINTSQI